MSKRPMSAMFFSVIAGSILLVGALAFSHKSSNKDSHGAFANSEDVMVMLADLKVESEKNTKVGKVLADRHWRVIHRCSTRAIVLKEESKTPIKYVSGKKCKPMSGAWTSPYDGHDYTSPQSLEIDHMVPRAEAWQSGAWKWGKERQKAFKNDLGYGPSLIAVSKSENGRGGKGEKEPGRNPENSKKYYLPPREEYVCTYVAEWVAVKYRWSLSVDPEEKSNLQDLLDSCRGSINVPIPQKVPFPTHR